MPLIKRPLLALDADNQGVVLFSPNLEFETEWVILLHQRSEIGAGCRVFRGESSKFRRFSEIRISNRRYGRFGTRDLAAASEGTLPERRLLELFMNIGSLETIELYERSVTATELISALPDSGIFHLRRRSGRLRTQPAAKSNLHLVDKLLTSERQTRVRRSPQLVVAKTG